MNLVEELEETINEELQNSSYFLVASAVNGDGSLIRFMLDGDEGIPIEECSRISRLLSRKIDEEELGDKPFRMEVSSPGVDLPLTNPRQFTKHIGRKVNVLTVSDEEFKGNLLSSNLEMIEVNKYLETKKGKPIKTEKITMEMADIKEIKVLISFK